MYGNYTVETSHETRVRITGLCPSCKQRFELHDNRIPWHQVAVWRDNNWSTAVLPNYYADTCWGSGKMGNELRCWQYRNHEVLK